MSCSKLPAGSYLTLARLSDLHLHKLSFPPVSSLIEFATESKFKLAKNPDLPPDIGAVGASLQCFFLLSTASELRGFAPDYQLVLRVNNFTLSCHLTVLFENFFKVLPTALI